MADGDLATSGFLLHDFSANSSMKQAVMDSTVHYPQQAMHGKIPDVSLVKLMALNSSGKVENLVGNNH